MLTFLEQAIERARENGTHTVENMLSATGCTELLERLSQHCCSELASKASGLLARFFDLQVEADYKSDVQPPAFVFS